MRPQASSTNSLGRFIEGGSRRSVSASSVCNAMSRGWVAVESSMSARQTLSSVSTAALTMPGRFLMASNSPRLDPTRAVRTASWSFSGSIGCRNSAGETAGELSHSHDLHAIGTAPGSADVRHVPRQFGVDDDRAAHGHV